MLSETEQIQAIATNALLASHYRHNRLGRKGIEPVITNQFHDTAMRGDIRAEGAILACWKLSGFPINVVSEEHGRKTVGKNPRHLAVLDGIDGSSLYKDQFGNDQFVKRMYGTLLGVYAGIDPKYGDSLFSGMMVHATGELFSCVRGQRSFSTNVNSGERRRLHTSTTTTLDTRTPMRVDSHWPESRAAYKKVYEAFNTIPNRSFTESFREILTGEALLILACAGRKNDIELAAGFELITEAGGVMQTLDGKNFAELDYLQTSQGEPFPVIIAANLAIAKALRSFLAQ